MMGAVRALAGLAARSFGHTGVGHARPRHGAQSHRRLRTDRARRPHPPPPAVRHHARHRRQPRGRGARRGGACHAVRDAAAFQEGHRQPSSRACCWWRRCRAISRRCCAAPCAPCCPSTTSTSPTGTTCATSRVTPAASASTSMSTHLIKFIEVIGEGAHVARGLPALRRGAGGGRGDGAEPEPGAAAQHDPDGRPDRHPRQSDQGQRACQFQIDRLVREEPDRARAVPLSTARSGRSIRALCSSRPS